MGEELLKMAFHESFANTQLTAKRLAVTSNERVRRNMTAIGLSPARAWDVTFLDCSVYEFVEQGSFRRGVLVEKLLEPPSRYTKWNGNNGYVHVPSSGVVPAARIDRAAGQLHHPRAEGATMMEVIVEDEEEEEDDDDGNSSVESEGGQGDLGDCFPAEGAEAPRGGPRAGEARKDAGLEELSRSFAPNAECYPQAFSHFSYCQTRRKMLVCDLQGVLSRSAAGEDRAGVFDLTDPVIHYKSKTGRHQVYGRTDLGRQGMDKFFHTHRCNDVCRLLGIGGVVP